MWCIRFVKRICEAFFFRPFPSLEGQTLVHAHERPSVHNMPCPGAADRGRAVVHAAAAASPPFWVKPPRSGALPFGFARGPAMGRHGKAPPPGGCFSGLEGRGRAADGVPGEHGCEPGGRGGSGRARLAGRPRAGCASMHADREARPDRPRPGGWGDSCFAERSEAKQRVSKANTLLSPKPSPALRT